MTPIVKCSTLFLAGLVITLSSAAQEQGITRLSLAIGPSTVSGGENAKGRITILREPNVARQPLQFKVASSHSNLIRFPTSEVTLPAAQDSVQFEIATAATQIDTPVTITASLGPAYALRTQAELLLVPALINRVTLNRTTMTGTLGSTIEVTAELKAPAPAGGIELYLSPLVLSPPVVRGRLFQLDNQRVPAGSRTVTFPIRYRDLIDTFSSTHLSARDFSRAFETETRRIEQIVALDPQGKTVWDPIRDRAVKVTFDLVPLRISSISVQPSSVPSQGEALATFTLNASPGANERVLLLASSSAIRVAMIGSSCQSTSAPVELELSAGVATHTFKVCGRPVTAPTTAEVIVTMRSGEFRAPVTVQP